MPIHLDCTHCRTPLRVSDGVAGHKTRCPKCKSVISVPAHELDDIELAEEASTPLTRTSLERRRVAALEDIARPFRFGWKVLKLLGLVIIIWAVTWMASCAMGGREAQQTIDEEDLRRQQLEKRLEENRDRQFQEVIRKANGR